MTLALDNPRVAELMEQILALQARPKDTTTVGELWAKYVTTLPDEVWVESVKSTMKPFIARAGAVPVKDLKPSHWEDYRCAPEIRGRYSVTTRNIQLRRARTCFNWAVNSGRLKENPFQRVKPEKGKARRSTEISREDEAAVLRFFDPMMKAFFLTAIDTAMRRGEICSLEWGDVDWVTLRVSIPAARTKTRKDRVTRLTARAAAAIRELPRVEGAPWVFTDERTGRPITGQRAWYLWRRAADAAGVKAAPGDGRARLHDARGTAATRMLRLGATLPAVQAILGHAQPTLTLHYLRCSSKDVDAAHHLLDQAVGT